MGSILVVEDRASLLEVWTRALESAGHEVLPARTVRAARSVLDERLEGGGIDLVLTDLRLPDGEGTEVVRAARAGSAEMPILMMTAYGNVKNAVEAMKLGATDFCEKPVDVEQICEQIEEWLGPSPRGPKVARDLGDGRSILGAHPRLRAALRLVDKVAPMESTVLLLGESGTGKELFARALHLGSKRRDGPFVAVNCAALPEALVENELFGHERGAFTGADRRGVGRFEAALGGTLFLDEIGELPLAVQGKILRVLEERLFERIGGSDSIVADVRLVAATNRDLATMVDDGTFRQDLFYRLEVFPIELPPLRDRTSDIPDLVEGLLERVAAKNGVPAPRLEVEALELLQQQEWPGNVRQLANVLERLVIVGSGSDRSAAEVAAALGEPAGDPEQELRDALRAADGNRERAAEQLGISVRTLHRRIQKYDLAGFPDYRN